MKSTTKKKNNINVSKNKTVTKKNKKLNKKKYNVLNNKNKNKYSKSKKNIKNKKNVSKLKLSTKTLKNKKKKKENKNKRFTKKKKLYGGGWKSFFRLKKKKKKKYSVSINNVSLNNTSISKLLKSMNVDEQEKIEKELYNIPKNEKLNKEKTIKEIEGIKCRYINKGTYSRVWEIIHEGVKLAIKIPLPGPPLDEIKILKDIEKNTYPNIYACDHIIPIKKFGIKSIIMIRADDNLLELKKDNPDFNNQNNLNIIKTIYHALNCLSKKKLYYYDIKFENIFYRKLNGNIEIFLGDIGSIQTLKQMKRFLMATFQTPYLRKANKERKIDEDKFFINFVQKEITNKQIDEQTFEKINKNLDSPGEIYYNFINHYKLRDELKQFDLDLKLYKTYPKLYYPWVLSLLGLNLSKGYQDFLFVWKSPEEKYNIEVERLKAEEKEQKNNSLLNFYIKNILYLIDEELKDPMQMQNKSAKTYIKNFEKAITNSLFTNI